MSRAHALPRTVAAAVIGSLLLPGSALVPFEAAASGGPVAGPGSHYLLRNSHTGGEPEVAYAFGSPRDEVLVGDWDGDGADTFGVRRGNAIILKNSHTGGDADLVYSFGAAGDSVLVGDWDGDGVDTVAVRRGNTVHLSNSHLGGDADLVYSLGSPDDVVVVGDWDGDGIDTLGLRRESSVFLWNSHGGGMPDVTLDYGRAGDVVLVGDWDGDGADTLGVRRGSTFHLATSHTGDGVVLTYSYGSAWDVPVAGDWDGNGTDTVGVRRVRPHPVVDPLRVTVVDLGTLGGASSTPAAVNDQGQVVGQAQARDGSWRPFLWERGTMTDLSPALSGARATDINNRGQVVLSRESGAAPEESVLWSHGGVVRLGQVEAIKVDEHGRVAGNVSRVDDSGRWNRNPFLWTVDGRADMGPAPTWEGRDSHFVDLNDDGVVLGMGLDEGGTERAFLWSDGAVVPVTKRFGDYVNSGVDLNNRREVLGSDVAPSRSGTSSAYVRDAGGRPGLLRFSARQRLVPSALNEHGQVTGSLRLGVGRRPGSARGEHAFLWTGERLVTVGPGGEASRGVAVNDRAQVVGQVERPVAGADLTAAAFVWQAGRSVLLPVPGSTSASEVTAISEMGHIIGTVTDRAGARKAVMWVLGD